MKFYFKGLLTHLSILFRFAEHDCILAWAILLSAVAFI